MVADGALHLKLFRWQKKMHERNLHLYSHLPYTTGAVLMAFPFQDNLCFAHRELSNGFT